MDALQVKADHIRMDALRIVMAGRCGHLGGDMSEVEILTALYDRMRISPQTADSPLRDRFVLSKGHCVETLYAVLADKGFLSMEDILTTYSAFQSKYIGHPSNRLPGIEMNSGSLGHGLSVCVGMALAGKRDEMSYRVYTLLGDGELAEGSVWEAAMAASHYRLDNLCAVIDRNGLQISGPTEAVMAHESLRDRFAAFGWNVVEAPNGNRAAEVSRALDEAQACKGRPTVIIAKTVKGCGSPLTENKAEWHHRVPTGEEYAEILQALERGREADGCE